jgi:transposase
MNKNKKGKPFEFPDSFILAIGYIRYSFRLPYRQTEGIINVTGKSLPSKPSYGHICKRINKLNVNINNGHVKNDDGYVIIAADSTGIKVTNRGQWMEEKWNVLNRKGYLKIHIAVNIKTKEILALEVTNEKEHDGSSRILKKLVNDVLDNQGIMIESVLADGAHDTNTNFQFLEQKGITSGIKVRKNSIICIRNNSLRNREVRLQTKDDLLKWKAKRKYGHRWIAETAFSTIKRTFGEYISATRFQNMVKEMMIKVSLYNLFRKI